MSSECGFEPYERDDGLHPAGRGTAAPYNAYLRERGYDGDNPWEQLGEFRSRPRTDACRTAGCSPMPTRRRGCRMRIPKRPGHDAPRHGLHRRGRADGRPWCLHLSYIKPHWPYIAPAPYHEHVRRPPTSSPRSAREQERQRRPSGLRRLHGYARTPAISRATRFASA